MVKTGKKTKIEHTPLDEEYYQTMCKHSKHTILMTGFAKSTIGTGLIGFGLITALSPLYAAPGTIPTYVSISGAFLIVLGVLIYFAGDIYKINQEEKMEKLRTERIKKLIDDKIEAEQERLANEIVEKAEKRKQVIDRDLAKQLIDIRNGICTDLESITEGDLEYCSEHIGNKHLDYIRYPDTIPSSEIIQIGIDKMKGRGEEVTIEKLFEYIKDLYHVGLISKTKRIECREKLEKGEN